ncbi:MAG TPA: C1 family peptidase [Verrucomicrobiae bacterium]|nr:C1 family peptidase [Verrucomicrobiae bacterium]
MPNYLHFHCPDNTANQQQHEVLEQRKQGGWRVTEVGKDPLDPNTMVITLNGMSSPVAAIRPQRVPAPKAKLGKRQVTLDARPDAVDFRDKLYVPTLVEVPSAWSLKEYLKIWGKAKPLILNQGQEGACTGFGLAAVAHYLLRRRKVHPDNTPVSPRMFCEMARRYDEWEGEGYSGSSARSALKGWHQHGVCGEAAWPYQASSADGTLTPQRAQDALRRPLAAYFRVNHRDLVAMHSALAEVGILYATAVVHEGWGSVTRDGVIPQSSHVTGGHAFALVGYDDEGFWLQNSWGPGWGRGGFARLSYEDWLTNGTDVWVARLGAPGIPATPKRGVFLPPATALSANISRAQLPQHTVAIGNDGRLRETGEVGNTKEDVERILGANGDFEKLTKRWTKKRLLIYAHGGLGSEKDALQRISESLPTLMDNEVYPLAFIWKTDFWSTIGNMLRDVLSSRRPKGLPDTAREFMLDRLDDSLELLAQSPGRLLWSEMKENAILSTESVHGGARLVLQLLIELSHRNPGVEIHFAGHSAGSIFLGPLLRRFCTNGRKVESLNLWAPACTIDFFRDNYADALASRHVQRFGLYTLKDPAERDDHCANIYHKSLLYLVAHACESRLRILLGNGMPLLGMEEFILREPAIFGVAADQIRREDPHAVKLKCGPDAWWIRSPNNLPTGEIFASAARHHGDFDNDRSTIQSTLARILGSSGPNAEGSSGRMGFRPTISRLKSCRQPISEQS